jgi:ATP-dependent protease HslVU (ClpYQ) ATPase subunit
MRHACGLCRLRCLPCLCRTADCDQIIRDLVDVAISMQKKQFRRRNARKIALAVEQRLLDALCSKEAGTHACTHARTSARTHLLVCLLATCLLAAA